MECRCPTVTELYGNEAGEYVASHLEPDAEGAFVCPGTGRLDASGPRLVQE